MSNSSTESQKESQSSSAEIQVSEAPAPFQKQGMTPVSELAPQVQEVCRLVAQGYTNREIGEMTGYTVQYISKIRNNPMAIPFIKELQAKRNHEMMKSERRSERLDGLRDEAYEVIEETMQDPSNTNHLRLRAAESAVRAHKEHIETLGAKAAPVFDSTRIAELLKEKNLIYVDPIEIEEDEEIEVTAETEAVGL